METLRGRNVDVGEIKIDKCECFHSVFSEEFTEEDPLFRMEIE